MKRRLTEAVRGAFEEETGIDVDALLSGTETGETAVTTEKSKAENERPRNNGPPEKNGAKYSIGYDAANTPYVIIDEDILADVPKSEWAKTVKKTLARKFPNGVRVGNNVIKINRDSRREMTFSKYTRWLSEHAGQAYADKFRAVNNADEIILASREYINEGLKHSRKDSIRDFARGTVLLRVGSNDYSAEVVVGITNNGDMLLYDIVNLQNTKIKEKSKHTIPPTEVSGSRSDVLASENSIRAENEKIKPNFSIDEDLPINLQRVLNGDFDAKNNEVHIGTTSNFLTDVIGANGLDLYMPAEKAYRAMATEEQAIFDGKPTGKNINYHGLDVDGLVNILNASEQPIAAFAAAADESGKRENRIVLVTDVEAKGGLGVVIEEMDTTARSAGDKIKANKAITVYPKGNVSSAIQEAIADHRILYLDEKRSQAHLAVRKGSNYPTVARKADFANNIRNFWANVKWKNTDKAKYTAESTEETTPEWKKRLAEFSEKHSIDDADGLRVRASRMSVNTLRERLSRVEGMIRGYEMTEELSEAKQKELDKLKENRDVFKEALEEKKKKAKANRARHLKCRNIARRILGKILSKRVRHGVFIHTCTSFISRIIHWRLYNKTDSELIIQKGQVKNSPVLFIRSLIYPIWQMYAIFPL